MINCAHPATVVLSVVLISQALGVQSQTSEQYAFEEVPAISLAAEVERETTTTEVRTTEVVVETERRTETLVGEEWDIWAPVRMRSANPQDTGTVQVLHTLDFSTSSGGTDDDVRTLLELQYGIAPNHEISAAFPMLLGDGEAEGNLNAELGWQWRLWEEKDWVPAFALRNELFLPSGEGAAGVDWRLTGLFTKSITPRWRVHSNPFLMVASGDSPRPTDPSDPMRFGNLRDFQWGIITGTEYLVADNLSVMLDYIHEASEYKGYRNQHSMELGAMWAITERHGLGLATRWTVDGDNVQENWGASITYSYTFNLPALAKR